MYITLAYLALLAARYIYVSSLWVNIPPSTPGSN